MGTQRTKTEWKAGCGVCSHRRLLHPLENEWFGYADLLVDTRKAKRARYRHIVKQNGANHKCKKKEKTRTSICVRLLFLVHCGLHHFYFTIYLCRQFHEQFTRLPGRFYPPPAFFIDTEVKKTATLWDNQRRGCPPKTRGGILKRFPRQDDRAASASKGMARKMGALNTTKRNQITIGIR